MEITDTTVITNILSDVKQTEALLSAAYSEFITKNTGVIPYKIELIIYGSTPQIEKRSIKK